MLSDYFDIKKNTYVNQQMLHVLKVNHSTGKLTIKHVSSYVNEAVCTVPKLNSSVNLSELKIKDEVFQYFMLYDDMQFTIFVCNEYSNKKLISDEDKQVRIKLYKVIISECLKDCIYRLTKVFKKTNSKDVGEEINQLMKLYQAYYAGTQ